MTINPTILNVTIVLLLLGISIPLAIDMNKTLQARNPGIRPFKWGYFIGIVGVLNSAVLGIIFFMSATVTASYECNLLYAKTLLMLLVGMAHYYMIKRNRIAWIIGTILSMNIFLWIINGIYLKHRWHEMDPTKGEDTE